MKIRTAVVVLALTLATAWTAQGHAATPPAAPAIRQAVVLGVAAAAPELGRLAYLQWSPVSGATAYRIYYRAVTLGSTGPWQCCLTRTDDTVAVIYGLPSSGEIEFAVTALTSAGESERGANTYRVAGDPGALGDGIGSVAGGTPTAGDQAATGLKTAAADAWRALEAEHRGYWEQEVAKLRQRDWQPTYFLQLSSLYEHRGTFYGFINEGLYQSSFGYFSLLRFSAETMSWENSDCIEHREDESGEEWSEIDYATTARRWQIPAEILKGWEQQLRARIAAGPDRFNAEFDSGPALTVTPATSAASNRQPVRVSLRWDRPVDLDLEIWDADGVHLLHRAFSQPRLNIRRENCGTDVTDGYGEEYWFFKRTSIDDFSSGEYVVSVAFPPTSGTATTAATATLTITQPDGSTVTRSRLVQMGKTNWHAIKIDAATGAYTIVDKIIEYKED